MAKESIISKYRRLNDTAIFSDIEWQCDIYSIFSDLISEYSQTVFYNSDKPFAIDIKSKQRLSELLKADLEEISDWCEPLQKIKQTIHFEELYDGFPGASTVIVDNLDDKLILFSTPLLHTIHVFFPYIELLSQPSKTENCLEKYDSIALSDDFDDTTLIMKIAREIKARFIDKKVEGFPDIYFVHSPFDACERVKAARKFIIAHEISHILLEHSKNKYKEIPSGDDSFSYNLFNRNQEYDADIFACKILISKFQNEDGTIKDLEEEEVHELTNTIMGIRLLFFMLEFVECFKEWYKIEPETPRPQIRDIYCANFFHFVLSKSVNIRILEYLESFSSRKIQLKRIFRTAYEIKLGLAGLFLFADAAFKTDDEIRKDYKDNPKKGEFFVRNKDHYIFLQKFETYNAELFDTISKVEFDEWLMYHYLQFGPNAAFGRFMLQMGYSKLPGNWAKIVSDYEEGRVELNMLILKRFDLQNFIDEIKNNPYPDLFKKCYSILDEYQNRLKHAN